MAGVTQGHTLRKEEGRLIEEVAFGSGLPGVAVKSGQQVIHVSFEKGLSLPFGERWEYYLMDSKGVVSDHGAASVIYGGNRYDVVKGVDINAGGLVVGPFEIGLCGKTGKLLRESGPDSHKGYCHNSHKNFLHLHAVFFLSSS